MAIGKAAVFDYTKVPALSPQISRSIEMISQGIGGYPISGIDEVQGNRKSPRNFDAWTSYPVSGTIGDPLHHSRCCRLPFLLELFGRLG
jgi:hypothetical protein